MQKYYKYNLMGSSQQEIEFRFPAVRSKLQNLFPFDPRSDIQILYKNNKYQLQTAYLRIQSGFFKNINTSTMKLIKIQGDFNEDYFEQTMKTFYGGTFKCQRNAIFQIWKIFSYLKLQTFINQIVSDIKLNSNKYPFFQLLTFGFVNNIEEIFNSCLIVLDHQNFIQLKTNKNDFLNCPLEVFRFLINMHNRRNIQKKALTFVQINNFLIQYCDRNQYSEDFYRQLKFELIQKTALGAQQYRLIFIVGSKTQSTKQLSQTNDISTKSSKRQNLGLVQSAQTRFQNSKAIKLQKKDNWKQQLQIMKQTFDQNKTDCKLLRISTQNLSSKMKKKSQQNLIKQQSLCRIEKLVRQIQSSINQKKQSLKKINQRVNKLQNAGKKYKGKASKDLKDTQQEYDQFVESHIIPSYFLGDVMTQVNNNIKKQANKPQQEAPSIINQNSSKHKKSITQQRIGQKSNPVDLSYKQSLKFDIQPLSIPKRYLPLLQKILQTDKFMKKKHLSLIFQRTSSSSIGSSQSIYNRSGLLILLQSSAKKYLGGYISVQIPSFTKSENLCDYQSFLFSLTHNTKMKINKNQQNQAISLSKHYLIAFANDLMISNDTLNQQSYCQWPSLYSQSNNHKCATAYDFVGGSEFRIQAIQIYQVKNQAVQMEL